MRQLVVYGMGFVCYFIFLSLSLSLSLALSLFYSLLLVPWSIRCFLIRFVRELLWEMKPPAYMAMRWWEGETSIHDDDDDNDDGRQLLTAAIISCKIFQFTHTNTHTIFMNSNNSSSSSNSKRTIVIVVIVAIMFNPFLSCFGILKIAQLTKWRAN